MTKGKTMKRKDKGWLEAYERLERIKEVVEHDYQDRGNSRLAGKIRAILDTDEPVKEYNCVCGKNPHNLQCIDQNSIPVKGGESLSAAIPGTLDGCQCSCHYQTDEDGVITVVRPKCPPGGEGIDDDHCPACGPPEKKETHQCLKHIGSLKGDSSSCEGCDKYKKRHEMKFPDAQVRPAFDPDCPQHGECWDCGLPDGEHEPACIEATHHQTFRDSKPKECSYCGHEEYQHNPDGTCGIVEEPCLCPKFKSKNSKKPKKLYDFTSAASPSYPCPKNCPVKFSHEHTEPPQKPSDVLVTKYFIRGDIEFFPLDEQAE